MYVYVQLSTSAVHRKITQHCESTTISFKKTNNKNKKQLVTPNDEHVGNNMEQQQCSYTVAGSVRWHNHFAAVSGNLIKVKDTFTLQPSNSIPRYLLRKIKTRPQRDFSRLTIATLSK